MSGPAIMTGAPRDVVHHAALDARMVEAVRDIRLLALASWPARVQVGFLERWRRGEAALPEVAYPSLDFDAQRRELDAIAIAAEPGHPLGDYLRESAASWSRAAALLEVLGTAQACTESIALFGRPDEALPGDGPTAREAARHFIQIASELDHELLAPQEQVPISATALSARARMRSATPLCSA